MSAAEAAARGKKGERKEKRGKKESDKGRKEDSKQKNVKKEPARVIGLRNKEISKIVIECGSLD